MKFADPRQLDQPGGDVAIDKVLAGTRGTAQPFQQHGESRAVATAHAGEVDDDPAGRLKAIVVVLERLPIYSVRGAPSSILPREEQS